MAGNINLSPGKSFQSSARNVYELVPYLRNDGNRHDFSHTIHYFFFMADDEYHPIKAKHGSEMRDKLGLTSNPLDETVARVNILSLFGWLLVDGMCQTSKAQYMFQYFVKVVSTQFRTIDGNSVSPW